MFAGLTSGYMAVDNILMTRETDTPEGGKKLDSFSQTHQRLQIFKVPKYLDTSHYFLAGAQSKSLVPIL